MEKVKLSSLIGGKVFFIGEWKGDEWRGNDKFTGMMSIWSQAMGVVNAHRGRESEKLKPENVGWAETPSEWSNRMQRTGRDVKALAKAHKQLEGIAAELIQHEKNMISLSQYKTSQ